MTAELLEAFAAGTLAERLEAEGRPEPVLARRPLEESTSETVRRHADTFRRWRPVPEAAPLPVQPAPEVYATPVELADLEWAKARLADAPGPVRTALRNAAAGRWRVRAEYGCGRALGRPEVVSESVVVRAARSPVLPWRTLRAVAVWRRTGEAGPWVFDVAYRWSLDSGVVVSPAERLTAGELAWWLKSGGTTTANPKPAKARRESKAIREARERGEFDEACPA